ncbi:uncharacterized protein AMSG_10943 [Thecamonas trahens ATCC 50062]|uniref:F-box domain-containing protein n=1 Tax=Thecamonas trahens ATCC 50062 TaxID=461836 RepID=A0A0L0DTC1_THETB|nr:hypothetical protein AMSG_10943 [Thecamonas trahens ATCC 50062]KNC55301.1 hypothetical protein AMSG_10943 [Thecamonas trahens ATCC 50062]|eukprot:XP_013753121.1 hypothetical protein AMSG_10943 [Thecamonas trahens ATCC 50062]
MNAQVKRFLAGGVLAPQPWSMMRLVGERDGMVYKGVEAHVALLADAWMLVTGLGSSIIHGMPQSLSSAMASDIYEHTYNLALGISSTAGSWGTSAQFVAGLGVGGGGSALASPLATLPDEIVVYLMGFLDRTSYRALATTCSQMWRIAHDRLLLRRLLALELQPAAASAIEAELGESDTSGMFVAYTALADVRKVKSARPGVPRALFKLIQIAVFLAQHCSVFNYDDKLTTAIAHCRATWSKRCDSVFGIRNPVRALTNMVTTQVRMALERDPTTNIMTSILLPLFTELPRRIEAAPRRLTDLERHIGQPVDAVAPLVARSSPWLVRDFLFISCAEPTPIELETLARHLVIQQARLDAMGTITCIPYSFLPGLHNAISVCRGIVEARELDNEAETARLVALCSDMADAAKRYSEREAAFREGFGPELELQLSFPDVPKYAVVDVKEKKAFRAIVAGTSIPTWMTKAVYESIFEDEPAVSAATMGKLVHVFSTNSVGRIASSPMINLAKLTEEAATLITSRVVDRAKLRDVAKHALDARHDLKIVGIRNAAQLGRYINDKSDLPFAEKLKRVEDEAASLLALVAGPRLRMEALIAVGLYGAARASQLAREKAIGSLVVTKLSTRGNSIDLPPVLRFLEPEITQFLRFGGYRSKFSPESFAHCAAVVEHFGLSVGQAAVQTVLADVASLDRLPFVCEVMTMAQCALGTTDALTSLVSRPLRDIETWLETPDAATELEQVEAEVGVAFRLAKLWCALRFLVHAGLVDSLPSAEGLTTVINAFVAEPEPMADSVLQHLLVVAKAGTELVQARLDTLRAALLLPPWLGIETMLELEAPWAVLLANDEPLPSDNAATPVPPELARRMRYWPDADAHYVARHWSQLSPEVFFELEQMLTSACKLGERVSHRLLAIVIGQASVGFHVNELWPCPICGIHHAIQVSLASHLHVVHGVQLASRCSSCLSPLVHGVLRNAHNCPKRYNVW